MGLDDPLVAGNRGPGSDNLGRGDNQVVRAPSFARAFREREGKEQYSVGAAAAGEIFKGTLGARTRSARGDGVGAEHHILAKIVRSGFELLSASDAQADIRPDSRPSRTARDCRLPRLVPR